MEAETSTFVLVHNFATFQTICVEAEYQYANFWSDEKQGERMWTKHSHFWSLFWVYQATAWFF